MAGIVTPQAIIDNGWNLYTICRCNSMLKHKFNHPEKPSLQLHWWVKYQMFVVMEYAKVKVQQTSISELENILKNL